MLVERWIKKSVSLRPGRGICKAHGLPATQDYACFCEPGPRQANTSMWPLVGAEAVWSMACAISWPAVVLRSLALLTA